MLASGWPAINQERLSGLGSSEVRCSSGYAFRAHSHSAADREALIMFALPSSLNRFTTDFSVDLCTRHSVTLIAQSRSGQPKKHMIVGRRIPTIRAPANQAFPTVASEGFLGRPVRAR